MRTLVIDSATEACSVALLEDDQVFSGDLRMLGRGHAEQLVPMIAALPGRGQADVIAVSLGPGSFTGLRVGLAAARALALAWDATLIGYPCLALVAAIARSRHGPQPVLVAMNGGHGEWFVEAFDEYGETSLSLQSLRPDAAVLVANAAIVAGSQAEALVAMRGHGHAVPLWPDARCFPLLPPPSLSQTVTPIYGRAPDAQLPMAAS